MSAESMAPVRAARFMSSFRGASMTSELRGQYYRGAPRNATGATAMSRAFMAALVRCRSAAERLDDADVAIGAVSERSQGFLVSGRVVRRHRLLKIVELDHDYA